MLLNQEGESFGDLASPKWRDMFFSLLLHVLVLTMMITFSLWKEQKHEKPLKRIEVALVSNKELATLQQRANPVDRPESRSIQTRIKPVEPELIRSPQAAPKPALKPVSAAKLIAKPETAPPACHKTAGST